MFGGAERRRSSNVRVKLFHELKQKFPTIPDEVIGNCISEQAGNTNNKKHPKIIEILEATVKSGNYPVGSMGRSSSQCEEQIFEHVIDTTESAIDTPETAPELTSNTRKKSSESQKHHKKQTKSDFEKNETTDHHKKDKRNKISSILRKTKIGKNLLKSEEKKLSKKYSYKSYLPKEKELISDSSSRETTPSTDQEEDETVPSLKVQFESASLNECLNDKSKSKTPPRSLEMNKNVTDSPDTKENTNLTNSPKRPTFLNLNSVKPDARGWRNTIQPSEKCKNLPKLLNANLLNDKPPRSPVHNKKIVNNKTKNVLSPGSDKEDNNTCCNNNNNTGAKKKETVSTPTQTTDTLLSDTASGSVNLSFNVNCSMDVIHSPVTPRRISTLQFTPEQPWLQEPTTPRSYTSVKLTLRPPSAIPQPPIDITSQNSSLTYSTSSFDSQKGLQSRLQITVGPTGSNVMACGIKPKSNDFDENSTKKFDVPVTGSLNNKMDNNESPVIIKQQARIEKLRIELKNEKARLIVLKKEISDLEQKTGERFVEVQTRELKQKIAHLRFQCRGLVQDLNADFSEHEFYNNLYRGQPLDVNGNRINNNRRARVSHPGAFSNQDTDGPKWSCHICTFLNHPQIDECEQCNMPRLIHVSAAPGDNIHIHVTPRMSRRIVRSWIL